MSHNCIDKVEFKNLDWYSTLEPEIKSIVKLLRDNGFNTECSCGHDMYVQCQYIMDGEIKRLHDLLYNNGYMNFKITIYVHRRNEGLYKNLKIEIK